MTERYAAQLGLKSCPWMQEAGLQRLIAALAQEGVEVRVVGGAVRDALLGIAGGDVDLAAPCEPDRVSEVLLAAGFKVVPIGYDFGTVLAVADGRGYELTSLRRDIETDGRHARVLYTRDWKEDAARRDFTVNALYADGQGRVYDYFGGLEDLAARRIRFVGEPEARIREDYLRVLRYFRFLAQLDSYETIDAPSLAACAKLASGLTALSGERLWRELSKLLLAKRPDQALALALPFCAVRRLAALSFGRGADLARPLRLSRAQGQKLACALSSQKRLRDGATPAAYRQLLYDVGSETGLDALLLSIADGGVEEESGLALLEVWRLWEAPFFPLKGKDLLTMGFEQGPQLGAFLEELCLWWRAQDFRPDRAACLGEAQKRLSER